MPDANEFKSKRPAFTVAFNSLPGAGKCLTGESLILGADGRVRSMRDIYEWKKFTAITYDGSELRPVEPSAYHRKYADHIIAVRTNRGKVIRGTPEHPLLTFNGWKSLGSFEVGDAILTTSNLSGFTGDEEADINWVRTVGYLLGDGGLSDGYPTFTNGNPMIMDDFLHGLAAMGVEANDVPQAEDKIRTRSVRPAGSLIKEMLADCGLWGRKSRTKFVPSFIFALKNELIIEFLRALFDTDGSLNKTLRPERKIFNYSISYGSVSHSLVQGISLLLSRLGIDNGVRLRPGKYNGESFEHWDLMITGWHSKKLFCEKIKPIKAMEISEEILSYQNRFDVTVPIADMRYESIVAKTEEPGEIVYDLTIPDYHNYIANGVVCHNTTAMMSFPKVYVIGCDPSGLDILYQKGNESLLKNLVWYEYLHNESEEELKRLFAETTTEPLTVPVSELKPGMIAKAASRAVGPDDRWSLYGCLAHAKQLAGEGKIQTLAIDGFNYLVDMKWQAINEYEEIKSAKTGERDVQGMYRNLGLYLQRFVAADLMTMATRNGLNVVLTTHLKRESPEALQGTSTRPGKVDKSAEIAPLIEGGFRAKFDGLLGAVIYLEHKYDPASKSLKYHAITERMPGLDSIAVPAKNRYGLHGRLDVTGKAFYELLMANVTPVAPTIKTTTSSK